MNSSSSSPKSQEQELEVKLTKLEQAQYALSFPSGLAAVNALAHLVQNGDHALVEYKSYHGTVVLFDKCMSRMGVQSTFIDMSDLEQIKNNLRPNTKIVWLETPTNPLLKLTDLTLACKLVRQTNPKAIIVTDNTFCTPYFQNPLKFGVDIVLHSVTKYLNGHSDVLIGCVMLNNENLYQQIKENRTNYGLVPSAFECQLVKTSLKTFKIRMQQHMVNTMAIAKELEANPRVLKVVYPPLASHPQHDLYKKQMTGFSGMLSIYIRGGKTEACLFIDNLKVFIYGESLGGVESLIKHPAFMNYSHIAREERKHLGIDDNLFRISVGLENIEDLLEDLSQALEKAVSL